MMARIMQIVVAKGLPRIGKSSNFGSYININGLDEVESGVENAETILLASIFGGTSTDGGAGFL
jgi:hypothetical protein